MTFGSLFAGVGGMDLGLERAGLRCVWQCEIDPFCRRVLAKHWPGVRRHDDVRTFPPTNPEEWSVDLICGGFPCQDISHAGKRAGIDGERSGLWREFARIVGLVRPRYVLVENVATLLVRGMGRVLGDLATLGYDAEWESLPASAFGAPHLRDRVFVLAYPRGPGLPDAEPERAFRGPVAQSDWWAAEPDMVRVAHGIPGRVGRIRALGNAVVPQVAQWLGERIIEHAGG